MDADGLTDGLSELDGLTEDCSVGLVEALGEIDDEDDDMVDPYL